MRLQSWVAVSAIVVAGACATSTAKQPNQGGGPQTDNSLLTADELWNATESNLFDLIRVRRPMWIRSQRPTTGRTAAEGGLVVYLDEFRLGGLDMLRQIAPNSVMAVRYFSPSAAQARFGPGHLNGAIQLSSRRRTN
jgi:hypothetical protein